MKKIKSSASKTKFKYVSSYLSKKPIEHKYEINKCHEYSSIIQGKGNIINQRHSIRLYSKSLIPVEKESYYSTCFIEYDFDSKSKIYLEFEESMFFLLDL